MIKTDYRDFFGVYKCDDVLVDKILDYYETNKHLTIQGAVTHKDGKSIVINKELKISNELPISAHHFYHPMEEYRKHLQESLQQYMNTYEDVDKHNRFYISEDYNIQHYPVGGGFKKWHFEANSNSSKSRILVFMTYLNDVDDGGTEFKYQNITIPAKKGLTLIWPSGFTHTHRGQISYTKEKIIITGWWSLMKDE